MNSIITTGRSFENFVEETNAYLETNYTDEGLPSVAFYPIFRDSILERVGTKEEYKPDYISLIKNQSYNYYKELFDGVIRRINNQIELEKISANIVEPVVNIPIEVNTYQLYEFIASDENALLIKRQILNNFKNNSPTLYAKNVEADNEFLNKKFYFRKSMENIFNKDLFLILGNKGTGKTFLYNALRSRIFIKELQKRANKEDENFSFINIISIKDEASPTKLLTVSNNFNISTLKESDFFFQRFWMVYTWNSIMLNSKEEVGFESKLSPQAFTNDTTTASFVLERIASDSAMIDIENELKFLDEYLKNTRRNLVILYDELDFVVKPVLWNKGIAPLINYWRTNPYSRILPKLFVRSDLFEKLGNVNNKQDLKGQSLSFEWERKELFSFLFKIVLGSSRSDFFSLMNYYGDYSLSFIKNIDQGIGTDNQVPSDDDFLRPLVETFFGKWVDQREQKSPTFGESYDWFYKNLKNADYTISLRPFIDLINQAIELYFANQQNDIKAKPILSSYYYSNPQSRLKAVENHFKDLADEEGNEDLKLIFEYIRVHAPIYLKKLTLTKYDFESLLLGLIKKYGDQLENKTIDSLTEFLTINGVVYVLNNPGGARLYYFALLYKYYFGLATHKPKRYAK